MQNRRFKCRYNGGFLENWLKLWLSNLLHNIWPIPWQDFLWCRSQTWQLQFCMLVQQVRGEKKSISLPLRNGMSLCLPSGWEAWWDGGVMRWSARQWKPRMCFDIFEGCVHKTYPESWFNPCALRQQLLGLSFFFPGFSSLCFGTDT